MNAIPGGANAYAAEIHAAIRTVLAEIDLSTSDLVVERIVDGIVARILRPFRRSKQADDIATDAITSLPFGAKGWSTPTTWEIEAKAAAREAALTLGDAATSSEMKVVARQAVEKIG